VALSLGTNIAELRNGSTRFHEVADATRTDLATVEIGGGRVPPQLSTGLLASVLRETGHGDVATGYMEAARQFGSPAFSLPELRARPEPIREQVDDELAGSLGLGLRPTSAPARDCRRITGKPGEGTTFELPPGGAVLTSTGASADLELRRFATEFTVPAGQLARGKEMALPIPRDSAPDPWYASTAASALEVCSTLDGGRPQ
jgi:hypothetical protein